MHALSPFTSVCLACLLLLFAIVGPARAAEIDDTVTRLDAQERTAAFIGYQVSPGPAGHACIPGCPASDWLMPQLDVLMGAKLRSQHCDEEAVVIPRTFMHACKQEKQAGAAALPFKHFIIETSYGQVSMHALRCSGRIQAIHAAHTGRIYVCARM